MSHAFAPDRSQSAEGAAESVLVLLRRSWRSLAKLLGAPNSEEEDREIEEALLASFREHPGLSTARVQAIVLNGQITLLGAVDDMAACDGVEAIASRLVGDENVESYLRVTASAYRECR